MKISKEYPSTDKFYRTAIRLLSSFLEEDRWLTQTEEDVVIFIMMFNGGLEGKLRKKLCNQLSCSTQSLSAHVKRIKLKGWIDEDGVIDKTLSTIQTNVNNKDFEMQINIKHG